uniref:Putative regulator of atp-sensitive k+ channels alpha-endosulfine/arpp-19 n=1 Tax=Panstrongylus lignarius TaxID=156445 RepID=A0A224Y1I3_9HEMI
MSEELEPTMMENESTEETLKQDCPKSIEKLEEAKLKAKYPLAGGAGHSAFLQKKLAKGQKYFDSGDYQMARQTSNVAAKTRQVQAPIFNFGTGEAIPTPESVPIRKTSIIQPKFHPPPSASPQT